MTKEGYQPTKNAIKKTTKINPPNTGSHVQMKKNGYTWEDLDRSFWEGFDNAKDKMEKRLAELEKEYKDLEWQFKEVIKDNDYWKAENKRLEKENAELKKKYEKVCTTAHNRGSFCICAMRENRIFEEKLTKAKEIIKELLDTQSRLDPYRDIFKDRVLKAEDFIKE